MTVVTKTGPKPWQRRVWRRLGWWWVFKSFLYYIYLYWLDFIVYIGCIFTRCATTTINLNATTVTSTNESRLPSTTTTIIQVLRAQTSHLASFGRLISRFFFLSPFFLKLTCVYSVYILVIYEIRDGRGGGNETGPKQCMAVMKTGPNNARCVVRVLGEFPLYFKVIDT